MKGKFPKETWDQQPYGLLSDKEIAETLGVTAQAVTRQRHLRRRPSVSDMCGGEFPSAADFEAGKPLNV